MRRMIFSHEREQGAIATIVVMLFGFGVMLALAALTVDVGSINAERRTLQNGADAAAMSVARDCVKNKTCPKYDDLALVNLVNANDPKDGHTKIARVDGKAAVCGVITTDGSLAACEALPSEPVLSDCPKPANLPAQYIRVYTQTQNSATQTDTILPPIFGQMVVGGYKGVTQQTCASVGITSLGSSYDALPIVVAQCAYDTMKGFPKMPPIPGASQTAIPVPKFPTTGGSPAESVDYSKYVMTIWAHNVSKAGDPAKCNASNSGLYLPGGFGWTTTTDGTHCTTNFNSDTGTVPISNGAAIPDGCKNGGTSPKLTVGTTVYIPIMTGITADKNSYIIDGLAGFYVAGYNAPAAQPKSYDGYMDNGSIKIPKLTGGDDGFWGWFTDDYVRTGEAGGTGTPRGPTTLANIG